MTDRILLQMTMVSAIALLVNISLPSVLRADTFGTSTNQFTLDFTTIGNPGNPDDTTGYGSVGYTYRIGTYDISETQLEDAANQSGQNYGGGDWSGDQPATSLNWYQAAGFVNWLNTNSGHQAAYNLTYNTNKGTFSMALWQSGQAGYDAGNPFRNSLALYVLPSEDEWYKAAYGKNDGSGYYHYPTSTGAVPIPVTSGTNDGTVIFSTSSNPVTSPASVYLAGGLSSYGTMGQGGNISQWEEGDITGTNTNTAGSRPTRACLGTVLTTPHLKSDYRLTGNPSGLGPGFAPWTGFRVAAVPEPSTLAFILLGGAALLTVAKRRNLL